MVKDDLEDSGEVLFASKFRLMPRCWFLLSRYRSPLLHNVVIVLCFGVLFMCWCVSVAGCLCEWMTL